MDIMPFLILFPLIPAALLLFVRGETAAKIIVWTSAAVIAAGSVALAATHCSAQKLYVEMNPQIWDTALNYGDILMLLVFLFACRKLRKSARLWIPLAIVAGNVPIIVWELAGRVPESPRCLMADNLSVLMCMVVGIVGGLIAIYTPSYLKRYHEEHPEFTDRRNVFLSAIFLFFFAMYGIIFSNKINWIYMFWEVTTFCSFVMIGYSRTREAEANSFRAVWMLSVGGWGLAFATVFASLSCRTVELGRIVESGKGAALIPAMLICFAGMSKAAQLPFSKWLLGAMVAPTPSSALLHSSTMVKAGVYLTLRCAPAICGTGYGMAVALIGAMSFLAGSAVAIAESDAKRVLAYSTIANLGLIVMCAGVGSRLALWAACMLIVFHAAAKALLFLCVGSVEQLTGSRDIEDMHGLITRRRPLALLMMVGIAGMFLAPFGMLISKWATMEAVVKSNPILALAVVFGGSMMLFFWCKWLGSIVAEDSRGPKPHGSLKLDERISLSGLALLVIVACAAFPWIGKALIEPMYGGDPILDSSHMRTISVMLALIVLLPFGFLIRRSGLKNVGPYLGGANTAEPDKFTGSLGVRDCQLRNYYLEEYFGEGRVIPSANALAVATLAAMFTMGFLL